MRLYDIPNIADPLRNRFLSEDRQFCHPCFLERKSSPNLVQIEPGSMCFCAANVAPLVFWWPFDQLPTGVGYFHSVTNEDAVFVLLVGARYYLPVVERQADHLFPP